MSFIAIDAKADVISGEGRKKGKMTPAQHAQLNAWCLAEKTGILDCLEKCEATSDSYTASSHIANIVFRKGYIVICGRLIECESSTIVPVQTPVSGSIEGRIILRFNLQNSGESEFVATTTTESLIQQDLNSNTSGTYEFELYRYIATETTVTLQERIVPYIPDIGGKLSQFITTLTGTGVVGTGNPPLQDYDKSKGTIEERLTRLGFREGSVALSIGTATTNTITRQGNYVVGNIIINDLTTTLTSEEGSFVFGVLPEGFRPKSQIIVGVTHLGTKIGNSNYVVIIPATHAVISTDGTITVYYNGKKHSGTGVTRLSFTGLQSFGFEAPPIE